MDKSKLTELVKELRLALGDTQQSFATRLGTAIRTVARWETIRPPHGEVLARFTLLAEEHHLTGLAANFRAALSDELGYPVPRIKAGRPADGAEHDRIAKSDYHLMRDYGLIRAILAEIEAGRSDKAIAKRLKTSIENVRELRGSGLQLSSKKSEREIQ